MSTNKTEKTSTMDTFATDQLRQNMSTILARVHHRDEPVTITKHGKPYVVIVSMDAYDFFRQLEDDMDSRAAEEALADPERHSLADVLSEMNVEVEKPSSRFSTLKNVG